MDRCVMMFVRDKRINRGYAVKLDKLYRCLKEIRSEGSYTLLTSVK